MASFGVRPLDKAAWPDFAQLVERHGASGAGHTWHETGYVFTTRIGHPIEPRDLARSFERITPADRAAADQASRPSPYCRSVPQEAPHRTAPNYAKEILGHARTTTTLAIYTSGDEDDQRSALDKISDLLFQPPQASDVVNCCCQGRRSGPR